MESIKNMKTDVSAVVGQAVTTTFVAMFGRNIKADGTGDGFVDGTRRDICSHISLSEGGNVNVEFYFRFDRGLLVEIARINFPDDEIPGIYEDIACEVANIVGSKVKAFLNGKGFGLEMNFPCISLADNSNGGEARDAAYLRFQYDGMTESDVGVLVNIQMHDRHKA